MSSPLAYTLHTPLLLTSRRFPVQIFRIGFVTVLLSACQGPSINDTGQTVRTTEPEDGVYEAIFSHIEPNECAQTQGMNLLDYGLKVILDTPELTIYWTIYGEPEEDISVACTLEGTSFDCLSADELEEHEGLDAITTAKSGMDGAWTDNTNFSGTTYVTYGCEGSDCETLDAEVCTSRLHYQAFMSQE